MRLVGCGGDDGLACDCLRRRDRGTVAADSAGVWQLRRPHHLFDKDYDGCDPSDSDERHTNSD